jgi:uncharacterized cupredoxin-like copper-binding protein
MSTPMAITHTQERMRLPTLRKVMIAGLVGNVLVFTVLQALILQTLIPELAIILALTLLVAGVCATRWRWAPLLMILWIILSVIPGLEPYAYDLTHPAETGTFIATLLGLALLLIAAVAGVAEMIYRYRQGAEGRAPRWLGGVLIGTVAFVLGASLVATIPSPGATAGLSPESLAALPGLTAKDFLFEQPSLTAKVGETVMLRLDNADTSIHHFDIDAFDVHVPMPSGESAFALFKPTAPGTYTFYCGVPGHTEAGMKGTLMVEP